MAVVQRRHAENWLRPWWDVNYEYALGAVIANAILLLVTFTSTPPPSTGPTITEDVIILKDPGSMSNDTTLPIIRVVSSEKPLSEALESPADSPAAGYSQDAEKAYFISCIAIFTAFWAFERATNKFIYGHPTLRAVALLGLRAEQRQQLGGPLDSEATGLGLVAANALQHSSDRRSLATILDIRNAVRIVENSVLLGVSVHMIVGMASSTGSATLTLSGLHITLIVVLLLLSSYSVAWRCSFCRLGLWGRLMAAYASAVEKVDVSRGRRVPAPPFHKQDLERVVPSLNPYAASANVRVALDLLAQRVGLGMALRCLADMAADVADNWKPMQMAFTRTQSGIEVRWKDPLAIHYFAALPNALALHYGIEMTSVGKAGDTIVKFVGFEETRYFRQVWHASRPSAVEIRLTDAFTYQEVITLEDQPLANANLRIDVWTIVDGGLIAKSSVLSLAHPDAEETSTAQPNVVPKPPRRMTHESKGESHSKVANSLRMSVEPKKSTQSRKELVSTPSLSAKSSFHSSLDEDEETAKRAVSLCGLNHRHDARKKRMRKVSSCGDLASHAEAAAAAPSAEARHAAYHNFAFECEMRDRLI